MVFFVTKDIYQFFVFCSFRFFENFVIHRRRRFCHVGELNVENEINVLNLALLYTSSVIEIIILIDIQ